MKNIIIWMLGLFLPPLAVAQTAQFGPLYWSASSTGAVQITTATYLAFPAVVDTLNLTITALNTTTAWTVNLYVASSPSGPWTTNCPGGTINGAAITVSAGTTLNLSCKPQGAAFLQIYVTAGTGGGQLVGSILGMNANVGALPLGGGVVTGYTTFSGGGQFTGGLTSTGYPWLSITDETGAAPQIYMNAAGYTQWAITACGYACFSGGGFGIATRGTGWIAPFQITQSSSTNGVVGLSALSFNTGASGQDTTIFSHTPRSFEDCGTSAGTCSSPTALASVTLTAANTITTGTVTSSALTTGHYFVFATTAGACTVLNATGSAEYRMS